MDAYESINEYRKPLITPHVISDEEYTKAWLDVKYDALPFDESTPEIYTDEGIRVRSKSEKIIAEKLDELSIPYRYEYPVKLRGKLIHPDFTLLDLKTRKEVILEHFGMMSDSNYAESFVWKMNKYAECNYILGGNLLATFESPKYPFNSQYLSQILNKRFG